MGITRLLDRQEKKMEDLPAITIVAAAMLAQANIQNQELIKALAHLGCSCTVKTREIDLDAHGAFCRFRMKMQDIEV